MDDHDRADGERDLADATAELSETLEALREELVAPQRGPLGLPRPPRPSELLRFTEQYTIPTLIALLETSIRVLDLLAAAIRIADGRPLDGEGHESLHGLSREGRDRLTAASRTTLERLDDALAELQTAATEGDPGPDHPEVQRLLEHARELRAEVDARLADTTAASDPSEADDTGGSGISVKETEEDTIGIDVDAELESIKRDLDESNDGRSDGDE